MRRQQHIDQVRGIGDAHRDAVARPDAERPQSRRVAVDGSVQRAVVDRLVAVEIGDPVAPAGIERALEQDFGHVHAGRVVEPRVEAEVGARVLGAELAVFVHAAPGYARPSVSISLP